MRPGANKQEDSLLKGDGVKILGGAGVGGGKGDDAVAAGPGEDYLGREIFGKKS